MFTCDICGKSFTTNRSLLRHMTHVHKQTAETENCSTCGKTFRDKANLNRCQHQRQVYTCSICSKIHNKKHNLLRHLQTHAKPKKVVLKVKDAKEKVDRKRRKVGKASSEEHSLPISDPDSPNGIPELDKFEENAGKIYNEHWPEIKTENMVHDSLTREYNLRLPNAIIVGDFLTGVHNHQTTSYYINLRIGAILRHVEGDLRFFYQSFNSRLFEGDVLISSQEDFNRFLEQYERLDLQQIPILKLRPDTKWNLHTITNITAVVTVVREHPVKGGVVLPEWIRSKRSLMALDAIRGCVYQDSLCLFRCLAIHLSQNYDAFESFAKHLFQQWLNANNVNSNPFEGVLLSELDAVEKLFQIPIAVYSLVPVVHISRPERDEGDVVMDEGEGDVVEDMIREQEAEAEAINSGRIAAEIVRRPKRKGDNVMYINLYETANGGHFSYIKSFDAYASSWQCPKCKRIQNHHGSYTRHVRSCNGAIIKDVYPGGSYATPKTIFEQLEDDGSVVAEEDRYYPYYITYDFESYQTPTATACQFEPIIGISAELPDEDPQQAPDDVDEFVYSNWNCISTRYFRTTKQYRIRTSNSADLQHYINIVAGKQREEFGFQVVLKLRDGDELKAVNLFKSQQLITCGADMAGLLQRLTCQYLTSIVRDRTLCAVTIKVSEEKTKILGKLEVASVSLATNVPGFSDETGQPSPVFIVSDGRPKHLVKQFYERLLQISSAAADIMKGKYSTEIAFISNNITYYEHERDSLVKQYPTLNSKGIWKDVPESVYRHFRQVINRVQHFKKMSQLITRFINIIPTVSFNGSRFDLKLIKKYLLPLLENPLIIKKGGHYMGIQTDQLCFLDVTNYIAPGTSYDKWIKSYNIVQRKSHWPHEWFTSLDLLEQTYLPPQDAYYSNLKQIGITNEEYEELQRVWLRENMQTMKDMLQYYNNLDVVPFLQALDCMRNWWMNQGIDMFKQGFSLPGLALISILKMKTPHSIFALENEANKDFYEMVKQNIVGGPSIVFTRYHEKEVTRIRDKENGKLCREILGFDANSLYLWCNTYNHMPTGIPVRWVPNDDGFFKRKSFYPNAQKELEWVEWMHYSMGIQFDHKFTSTKAPTVCGYQVDGINRKHKLVLLFDGCRWHKHDCELTHNCKMSREEVAACHAKDARVKRNIEAEGYTVVRLRECEWEQMKKANNRLQQFRHENFAMRPHGAMTETKLLGEIKNGRFFGLVECDVHVPKELREQFAEFPPIFKNVEIGRQHLQGKMKQFVEDEDLLRQPVRTLIASYFGKKILLATPYIKWLLEHGLQVTRIHQAFEFKPKVCFKSFGDCIADARRAADIDSNRAEEGIARKLQGNACYGKTLTNVDKHTQCSIVNQANAAKLLKNPYFASLEGVGDETYEVQMKTKKVTHQLPHLIGFFVYQYAKLRMLEFYYDFLAKFWDRSDFELIETDTDSFYIAVSSTDFESLVKPELIEGYLCVRDQFLPRRGQWQQYDERTPGLFKIEWRGDGMIAMNSKTYVGWGEKDKLSTKGLPKNINKLTKNDFAAVLTDKHSKSGLVKTFKQMRDGQFSRLDITRYGLTYLYYKRIVLDDDVSTAPYDNL